MEAESARGIDKDIPALYGVPTPSSLSESVIVAAEFAMP
jgi:hypothetical protein